MSKIASLEKNKKYQKKLRVQKKLKKNELMFIEKFKKRKQSLINQYWKLTEDRILKVKELYERKLERRIRREELKLAKKKANEARRLRGKREIEDKWVSKRKHVLDKVFSLYIRARDHNRCVTCWTTENPTNWHLFSRVANSTRFDELNCHCQCSGCNMQHENDPQPFIRRFKNKYWEQAFEDLHTKRHTTIKFDIQWYKEKIQYYKQQTLSLKQEDVKISD